MIFASWPKYLARYSRPCTPYIPQPRCYSKLVPSIEALDFANRKQSLLQSEKDFYPVLQKPAKDVKRLRVPEFRSQWQHLEHSPVPDTQVHTELQGRIHSLRESGKNLVFLDIVQDFQKVQIVVNRKKLTTELSLEEFAQNHKLLRRGDIVAVSGYPWRTKRGELSLLASRGVQLLSPCLHPIPTNDLAESTRMHNRVVDLLTSEQSRDILVARSDIIKLIRGYFDSKGFVEVQTPMLASMAGGATARPFTTKSNSLTSDGSELELSLRIAPELWLKRLVVAGFDKVYEIGSCFRNEGIDSTHNPEFTSCEFYQSYTTLDELVSLTDELLTAISRQIAAKFPSLGDGAAQEFVIAFQNGPLIVDFIAEIESLTGESLPEDLDNVELLTAYCQRHGVTKLASGDLSPVKLLDKLCGHLLEPLSHEKPVYITNHPSVMAPLAKSQVVDYNGISRRVSRRFELFYKGKELANAYEEENSPFEQESKFRAQQEYRTKYQDDESPVPDQSYLDAMEWGLPPTGGWGLGIDRLCMMLTGSKRISQVLTFGSIKVVNYQ